MNLQQSPGYEELTREFLQSVLDYNPGTGRFSWKDTRYSKECVKVGDSAEHIMNEKTGHRAINLFPFSFSSARLAILYMTGTHVHGTPKHLNGDNGDNRIENLWWFEKKEELPAVLRGSKKINFHIEETGRYVSIAKEDIPYLRELLNKYTE